MVGRGHWRAGLAAGLMAGWLAGSAPALPRYDAAGPSPLRKRGAEVGVSLLLEYYHELIKPLEEEEDPARVEAGLERFKKKVGARYGEGTLQRLLGASDPEVRRAAVLALRLLGTMRSNDALAAMLRDDDPVVRHLTTDALWALWFRGDTDEHNRELQRLVRLKNPAKALAGFNALIAKAPRFAEAYNQRAILYFKLGELEKSVADCQAVLKLNPHHFGALSGMAQCYVQLNKRREALQAFRDLLRLHPTMEGVEEAIRALEEALGEEGKPGDRK